MKKITKSLLLSGLIISGGSSFAQEEAPITNKKGSEYQFEIIADNDATGVQNQNRTGTCWSFSSLSFFESELLRMKKGKHNLSEMFIVRNAYIGKAENYLRMYGTFNFGQGGAFHDIPWVIERYGIVPEEVYKGLEYGSETHSHEEMEQMMKAMVGVLAKKPQGGKLSGNWKKAISGVVDAYLGDLPDENMEEFKFTYEGNEYTPMSFSQSLGWSMDDYVSLTSYTHHPFYSQFALEVQDNWAMRTGYNLPIDELMQVMEESVKNGYTFAWGADVSEKGFSFRDALAILPEDESTIKAKGKDDKYFNSAGAEKVSNAFLTPGTERTVSQKERQEAFDSQET
ncbi:aminopeptidase, partial [Flavobacteriales bacterium]|nr:aminopeptidase [Flavobacteriales bacterium]